MKTRLIITTLLLLAAMAGCAALDKTAEKVQTVTHDPIVQEIGETIPYGSTILAAVNAGVAIYLGIRKRQWKTAFKTVVETVDPYIPADEAKRLELKTQQGEQVTAMVKAAKK